MENKLKTWLIALSVFVGLLAICVVMLLARPMAAPITTSAKVVVPPPAKNEPTSAKVVWVNSDSLIANYVSYKSLQKRLDAQEASLSRDLQNREAALMQDVQAYQQKAQSLSPDQRSLTEANLQRREQEYYKFRDEAAKKLDDQRAKQIEQLQKEVAAYLKDFNSQRHYQYILGYTKGGMVLLADTSLDITQVVVKGLNQTFKARQAK